MGFIPAVIRAVSRIEAIDGLESFALSGETATETAEHATVDPNLLVLSFLLGFCLLYVFLLALDALEGRQQLNTLVARRSSPTPSTKHERFSTRPARGPSERHLAK